MQASCGRRRSRQRSRAPTPQATRPPRRHSHARAPRAGRQQPAARRPRREHPSRGQRTGCTCTRLLGAGACGVRRSTCGGAGRGTPAAARDLLKIQPPQKGARVAAISALPLLACHAPCTVSGRTREGHAALVTATACLAWPPPPAPRGSACQSACCDTLCAPS